MNEPMLEKLLNAKKYQDVCPDTVRRVWAECREKYKRPKEAERAAREAEKAAEREERAREKQTQDVIKNIGKIATSFLGAFGRDAAKEIIRGLFGTRRR